METVSNIEKNIQLIEEGSKNLCLLFETTEYEFFEHIEFDELENTPTILLRLKNNKSRITFYSPDLGNCCFFVHDGINNFYEEEYINDVPYKSWYSKLVYEDIQDILHHIETNGERINLIYKSL